MVLKSVLRPSRFGFGNKQVACESSLNRSDNAKDADTSCVASSHKEHGEKDASDYNGSHSHAGRGGDDVQLKRKPSSSRRVRGLWNERDSCSYFAQLQVEIISDGIFSFLTLEERVMSAMTCRRFAYCSQQPGCWAGMDATSYVERLYHAHLARASNELAERKGCGTSSTSRSNKSPQQLAKERTSAALIALITGHKNDIERLVVRNIDHRLTSDVAAMGIGACLAVGRLHEIELTDYVELTDASISVMFLSRFCGSDDSTQTIRSRTVTIPPQSSLAANTRHGGGRKIVSISPRFKLLEAKQNTLPPRRPLSTLSLERCPLLTDKAFRLIGANCSDLLKLSLCGCEGITDSGLLALSPMIKCLSHEEARSSSSPNCSNTDIFMPRPETDTSTTHPMLTPPASPKAFGRCMSAPSKPASSSLSSLFETSSPSSVVVASSLPSSPSFLSIFDEGREDHSSSTPACRPKNTDSNTSVQTTTSLSLIRPKEVQRGIDEKQKRCLSSLDFAHTSISAEGVIALFSSDGDTIATSVPIDELVLSITNGSEPSLKTVSKLRSLMRRPSALNLVLSAGAEAEDR